MRPIALLARPGCGSGRNRWTTAAPDRWVRVAARRGGGATGVGLPWAWGAAGRAPPQATVWDTLEDTRFDTGLLVAA